MLEKLETEAARYILRQEEGDWSPSDQREFDEWLQKSARHKAVFWRLQHGWSAADRIKALNLHPDPDYDDDSEALPASWGRRLWITAGPALAASMLLAALLGFVAFRPEAPPRFEQYATAIGQRKILTLADGTEIDLNTDSAIRVAVSGKSRVAFLDRGEAYFQVAKDKRPFVVQARDRQIQVMGTKFLVRRKGSEIRTSVVEGRVRFGRVVADKVRDTLILQRGDGAISHGSQTLAFYDDMDQVDKLLGWRQGLLVFDRITLQEAADEFNRYNVRKLIVADRESGKIKIGGVFKQGNVGGFSRLLADAYGLKVREDGSRILISEN